MNKKSAIGFIYLSLNVLPNDITEKIHIFTVLNVYDAYAVNYQLFHILMILMIFRVIC